MSDPAQEMAERLHAGKGRVRSVSGNWMCTCPAHADKNPSLAIRYMNDRIVYRCFAGCSFTEIAMQVRRLGYDPTNGERLRDRSGKEIDAQAMKPVRTIVTEQEEMERRFHRDYEYAPHADPAWIENPRAFADAKAGSKVTKYVYRDATGHPMMTVTRIDKRDADGNRHKEMVPASPWRQRANGRVYFPRRTMPAPRVPYGLERLAKPGPVFSVEGEKCADALFGLLEGRFAVFSVYGSTPEHADFAAIRERTVINMTDIDKGGRNYRERLTAALGDRVVHVATPWRGAATTRPPQGWDIADEIEGKDGLVTPIGIDDFVTHLSRQLRQIVRPDHDALLKQAIAALRSEFAKGQEESARG